MRRRPTLVGRLAMAVLFALLTVVAVQGLADAEERNPCWPFKPPCARIPGSAPATGSPQIPGPPPVQGSHQPGAHPSPSPSPKPTPSPTTAQCKQLKAHADAQCKQCRDSRAKPPASRLPAGNKGMSCDDARRYMEDKCGNQVSRYSSGHDWCPGAQTAYYQACGQAPPEVNKAQDAALQRQCSEASIAYQEQCPGKGAAPTC